MKCPKCNEQAISVFHYAVKLTNKSFKCKNCGTVLKIGKPKRIVLGAAIIGCCMGLGTALIEKIFDIHLVWLYILLTIIVIAIIADILIWRYGKLEEVKERD